MWIIPSCTHSMQQTPTKNGGKLINAEPLISKKKEKTPTTTTTTSTSYAKEDKVHINIANIEPTTGDSQQGKRSKIFLSDSTTNPRLAHISMEISSTTRQNRRQKVIALHDSGCAKSVIKTSIFEELLKKGHIEITKPIQRTVVVTCTGAMEDVTGTADIILHFVGDNKRKMSFNLNVIVHPSITQDFLLGRDFTGSDAKAAETNDYLYLTQSYDVYWDKISDITKSKSICNVPIMNSICTPYNVITNNTTWIPPFAVVEVICSIPKKSNPSRLPLRSLHKAHTFEVITSAHPNLHTLPTMSLFTDIKHVVIPVINKTHEDLILDKDTPVAQIEICYNDIEIHNCKVEMSDYTPPIQIPCNSTKTRPNFIDDDEALSEEEKEEAFMDYMKHGYHHPSMTKEVEDHAALTELYLKSTKPIPDDQFDQQFDVKHLPPKERKEALRIFHKHKGAFSKHACDLGKANNLEMSIPLTTTEPHIQKYIPIPHTVRDQVKLILDQMEEFGIIRQCNEPSIFCSNLLVTK